MPNIWTHVLFCEEVVDALHLPALSAEEDTMMKLGAQGPDPFFYYNFWPWLQNERIQKIGELMHTKHCGPFLIDLIQVAKQRDKQMKAYVFGFITHHLLDRSTHPYIHYRAGYEGSKHQKLEVQIDTLMMEKYHRLKTWKAASYKEIDVGFSMPKHILYVLHRTIQKYYPEVAFDTPKYIQKAYRDMKWALRILADPHGWKNTIFPSLISPYSHQPINDQIDYLNLERNTWYHSATKEPYTDSFIDLYEQAKLTGIQVAKNVLQYWLNDDHRTMKKLQEMIGNISYDTGKPVELHLQNMYCDPIL
ncbi:MAG TPA: zinc dependent phospholipase C family protein [Bacillota bacterium]|nr:zinc dependent phospholipase C family protein [Bacillota bacterium]